MKFSTAVTTLISSGAIVSALPHVDVHQEDAHQHKRAVAYKYVYETVVVDSDGHTVTPAASEVATAATSAIITTSVLAPTSSAAAADSSASIAVSSAALAKNEKISDAAASATASTSQGASSSSSSATSTLESSSVSSSSEEAAPTSTVVSTSSATQSSASSVTKSSTSSTSPSTSTSTSTSSGSGSIYGDLADFSGPSEKFQDGTIPCDKFPSGQGVISIDWIGEGGWSGVENTDTSTGGSCKEGSYCSYSCQPGMSKTQWPSDQPSDGRSVGGLLCKNGYLYRSNTDADYLCEWGVEAAYVVSKLSKGVAICRTDYPGTENMVIPTYVEGGSSLPLTVVDQDTYFTWEGKKTSAQYYVNNAGVSVEDGCIWGTSGSGIGNWAPLNFGAGSTGGVTYLSLIPNPNNSDALNYNVKIVAADDSSNVIGECVYENGEFSGGADGCTVSVTSGKAHFVLYN
ncbi:CLL_collapsed_G0026230.mRNA.1.CDS.1 [Saccharomyces cerevisiae]|uniref:K7_Sim1p n=1 Tax=Saccharomyces cerevisiae (strain Kyokai no. 7 / NBRC 101557) TaxID=721032 RepID=G2WG28_YEASK|nr:CLN_G0026350.mRNA.1.CDS.1 [Saccharomyces cerevisiae]GAA23997.1 K7_Sim1p [Saccharomyces cerevisiae Kyokai no. 7]CAI4393176.1 ADQ_G0026150.mRNA.1.CDS.1 [Saccharomyces cerevisiae]CAI4937682.1 CRE_HP_G0028420.mRNA.1.CDS.1 [Saccharomyces cerevisiae]CAI5075019.1 CRE_HP_G0118750.mRNA.1.CDS.1 [Saccharomyces cerevisiae]